MSSSTKTCALCPKLCRHVCPVAVGTGLESTTPTAIMTEIMLAESKKPIPNTAIDALNLCTRCNQCADFCGVDQPVVALLDSARTQLEAPPPRWIPPTVHGHSPTVAILCDERAWHEPLSKLTGQEMATLRTPDHLGEQHRIRTDTKNEVISALAKLMQGRTAITSCGTCRTALQDASITVEAIHVVSQLVPPLPTWRTCHCDPGPSVDTVIRCCGARAPLMIAESELSDTIAAEVGRRLDGQAIFVPDTRCATHLQNAGVQAVGPIDPLFDTEH